MHHPTDRKHILQPLVEFVTPVVEHWLEREIAHWVHHEGSIRRPITLWPNAVTTVLDWWHTRPSSENKIKTITCTYSRYKKSCCFVNVDVFFCWRLEPADKTFIFAKVVHLSGVVYEAFLRLITLQEIFHIFKPLHKVQGPKTDKTASVLNFIFLLSASICL